MYSKPTQVLAYSLGLGTLVQDEMKLRRHMKAELQYNDSPYGLLVMTGMNSHYNNTVNVKFIDGVKFCIFHGSFMKCQPGSKSNDLIGDMPRTTTYISFLPNSLLPTKGFSGSLRIRKATRDSFH